MSHVLHYLDTAVEKIRANEVAAVFLAVEAVVSYVVRTEDSGADGQTREAPSLFPRLTLGYWINILAMAYKVANESRYGWMTEKCYRQGEIFQEESGDVWFEKDDLTAEEKLESFREAEKSAKLALERKSEFGAENPPDVQCYGCGAFGHTRKYCPS